MVASPGEQGECTNSCCPAPPLPSYPPSPSISRRFSDLKFEPESRVGIRELVSSDCTTSKEEISENVILSSKKEEDRRIIPSQDGGERWK